MNSIEDFIHRRFEKDCHWTDGNCYWFAEILCKQFPSLEIVYLYIPGHFVAADMLAGVYYDWTGKHELNIEECYLVSELKENDSNYYRRLMRDCRN